MGASNAANTKTIAQVMCANDPNLDLISLSSFQVQFCFWSNQFGDVVFVYLQTDQPGIARAATLKLDYGVLKKGNQQRRSWPHFVSALARCQALFLTNFSD
jgi:hypothetical protein